MCSVAARARRDQRASILGRASPYGSAFPQVTVRDMVRLQYALLRGLGVRRLAAVAGGSLGGMQVLEWLVSYPEFVDAAIPIGSSLAHTAQGIAYNLVGREAIMLDPAWQGGDYYGTGHAPDKGLALARMLGMITYQSDEFMRRKFARKAVAATANGTTGEPLPGGELPLLPGRVAGQALRRQQLPGPLARRWTCTTWAYKRGGIDAALAGRRCHAHPGDRHQTAIFSSPRTCSAKRRSRVARGRPPRASITRSPRRGDTTPF